MNLAPQGSPASAASASARLRMRTMMAAPVASGPLIIRLGSAKDAAAARMFPRRRASDHFLMTATAAGSAGTLVGPGAGIVWGACPEPGPGGAVVRGPAEPQPVTIPT